jgi:hypothetical protein
MLLLLSFSADDRRPVQLFGAMIFNVVDVASVVLSWMTMMETSTGMRNGKSY